jgi:hypothetical protein
MVLVPFLVICCSLLVFLPGYALSASKGLCVALPSMPELLALLVVPLMFSIRRFSVA